MDKFIKILFLFIVLIAIIWVTMEFLPAGTGFNYYFRYYTYNYTILKYLIQYLPYIGIIISIIYLVKIKREKLYIWLLIISLFDALYIFRPHVINYINQSANTNMSMHPQNSETPLYKYLEQNNTKNIIRLLESGANPNEKIQQYPAYIIQAIKQNNYLATKTLIEHGANVNAVHMMSALHFAVKSNNLKLVKLLLDYKAKVDIRANNRNEKYWKLDPILANCGKTALFIAVENNNSEIVRLLLDNNAQASIKNYFGLTAMNFATDKNISTMLNENNIK